MDYFLESNKIMNFYNFSSFICIGLTVINFIIFKKTYIKKDNDTILVNVYKLVLLKKMEFFSSAFYGGVFIFYFYSFVTNLSDYLSFLVSLLWLVNAVMTYLHFLETQRACNLLEMEKNN